MASEKLAFSYLKIQSSAFRSSCLLFLTTVALIGVGDGGELQLATQENSPLSRNQSDQLEARQIIPIKPNSNQVQRESTSQYTLSKRIESSDSDCSFQIKVAPPMVDHSCFIVETPFYVIARKVLDVTENNGSSEPLLSGVTGAVRSSKEKLSTNQQRKQVMRRHASRKRFVVVDVGGKFAFRTQ